MLILNATWLVCILWPCGLECQFLGPCHYACGGNNLCYDCYTSSRITAHPALLVYSPGENYSPKPSRNNYFQSQQKRALSNIACIKDFYYLLLMDWPWDGAFFKCAIAVHLACMQAPRNSRLCYCMHPKISYR